jgi:osmotically-inducible protein OsmY
MARVVILLAVLPLAGCKARDIELLGAACQKAAQKLGLSRGAAAGTLAGALRGALGETSLSARVESRLRWESALADASIEVHPGGNGVVTLRGTVAGPGLRQKAVEVARTTLGVERVLDELEVTEGG